ncbi:MAG: hypothetical protein R3C59_04975 [Planctomycetaceae bacterium]
MESSLSPDDSSLPPHSGTAPSWTVSVCFWITLLLAATTYAAVALAPKFCVWNQVRLEYRHYAKELITLEDDVTYLERVESALKTDPEFRERVAGTSRPLSTDGEELIPVSGSLLFGHQDTSLNTTATADIPKYHVVAELIASHTRLRLVLLSVAALLTIFAFSFLNEAGSGFVYATGKLVKTVVMVPISRYVAEPEERLET